MYNDVGIFITPSGHKDEEWIGANVDGVTYSRREHDGY